MRGLFAAGPEPEPLEAMRVIVASVVPSLRFPMRQALRQILGREPLFVEPGVKTGMPILYDVPQEVGADRIVNAVAAFERLGGPCIVVDFGTATTFDVVTAKGEYAGGVIVPGIRSRPRRSSRRPRASGASRSGGPSASSARRRPARSSRASTSATSRSSTG